MLTDFLDPCVHEALYLVSPSAGRGDGSRGTDLSLSVTPYCVLWLEWGDGREAGRDAIVPVEPGRRDVALRAWFRGCKTTLADVIEIGVLSRRAARSYLEARVCEDEDGRIYTYEVEDGEALDRPEPDDRDPGVG